MLSATLIVITIVLAILTVTTFILNGIVLLALTFGCRQQVTSTFSKTLTVSLVTSDLLISLTLMPKSLYDIVDGKWLQEEIACRLFVGLDAVLCTASIFHLTGLTFDRYLAVCHPFVHRRLSVSWARVTCILFWSTSAAIGSFSFLPPTQIETVRNFTKAHTEVILQDDNNCYLSISFIYFFFLSFILFVIPLAVMTVFHVAIIRKLRTPMRSLPANSRAGLTLDWKMVSVPEVRLEVGSPNPNTDLNNDIRRDTNVCTQIDLQANDSEQADYTEHNTTPHELITEGFQGQGNSKRIRTKGITLTSTKKQAADRAMKTIACLVLCFVICLAPSCLVIMISVIGWLAVPQDIILFLNWFAYANSTVNPFLYYYFNKTIRGAIRRFLRLTNTR